MRAPAVVVATDPTSAGRLTGTSTPAMKGLSTYWFDAPEAPTELDLVLLDGRGPGGGPVVNASVMTNAAHTYAPPGRHLVQATTLLRRGTEPSNDEERVVRRQLQHMLAMSTSDWRLVVTHHVRNALPEQLPPLELRLPVDLGRRTLHGRRPPRHRLHAGRSGVRAAGGSRRETFPRRVSSSRTYRLS